MFISTRRFPNRLVRVRVRLAIALLHLSRNEMAAEAAFKDVPEIFEVTIHEIISSHAFIHIPA
jgi:hypothetical protein